MRRISDFVAKYPEAFVAIVALIPRAVLAWWRAISFATCGSGDRLCSVGGDSGTYLDMIKHAATVGDLSYRIMGARPPLFALVGSLITRTGWGVPGLLAMQAVFGALTCVLVYLAARLLFSRITTITNPKRLALAVGFVAALDPAMIAHSVEIMSEALFNLMFTACLLLLIVYLNRPKWITLVASAACMGLAMWTRNTGIYFWLAVPIIVIPLNQQWWKPVAVFTLVGLAVYLGWSYRNWLYTGNFTYSTQSYWTLLFLRGLSAEHLTTGKVVSDLYVVYIHDLYQRVGETRSLAAISPKEIWELWVPETPAMYQAIGEMAKEKLLTFLPMAVISTPVGVWRMFSETSDYPVWIRIPEVIYRFGLYICAGLGVWQAVRIKERRLLLITLVPIVYVTGLTLVGQISAMDTRMATPVLWLIMILAVYGFAYGRQHVPLLRKMGSSPEPETKTGT